MPRAPAKRAKPGDGSKVEAQILSAATAEFAERGLNGARLDIIATRARTTRAMIYYYFGGREALYLTALEAAYRKIRVAESELDIAHMEPVAGVRRLVEFVFDYYQANPTFVALVVAENQTGGRYIRKLRKMREINLSIVDTLTDVLARGAQSGAFRRGIDPIDVHLAISALGIFQIANRATFSYIFRRDLGDRREIAKNRQLVVEIVLRYVGSPTRAADARATSMLDAALA